MIWITNERNFIELMERDWAREHTSSISGSGLKGISSKWLGNDKIKSDKIYKMTSFSFSFFNGIDIYNDMKKMFGFFNILEFSVW